MRASPGAEMIGRYVGAGEEKFGSLEQRVQQLRGERAQDVERRGKAVAGSRSAC
jgi:hypothetical protein